jgi:16S rRNA (adenine1518-N6/adenine1519-N6)-dimethyltransferase
MSYFAKKSLGQNFLMHAQTAERIVAAAHLPAGATVLEVGPGTGMLTRELLRVAGKVVAVEADGSLIPGLKEAFADELSAGKLELVHADIRAFNLSSLGVPYHVVANIPYYITGDIMRMLFEADSKPASITVLVQKEVAERIARSGGKESILSISVAAYGTPKYAFTVPRGAFIPAPSVDSAVLHVEDIRQDAFGSKQEESRFFSILKAGFAHKRKKLAKNLEAVAPASEISQAFEQAQLSPNARAETLSVTQWRSLASLLQSPS